MVVIPFPHLQFASNAYKYYVLTDIGHLWCSQLCTSLVFQVVHQCLFPLNYKVNTAWTCIASVILFSCSFLTWWCFSCSQTPHKPCVRNSWKPWKTGMSPYLSIGRHFGLELDLTLSFIPLNILYLMLWPKHMFRDTCSSVMEEFLVPTGTKLLPHIEKNV